MNCCRDRLGALVAWVMDCVPTEYRAWSYFVLAAAILVAGQVSAHLERKMSEPLVLDSLMASCARMGAAAVELRAGYREVEPHLMSWGRALEAVGDWFVVPVLYRGIDYEVTCRATVMETRIRVDLAGIDPLPLAGPWGLPAVPGLRPASR